MKMIKLFFILLLHVLSLSVAAQNQNGTSINDKYKTRLNAGIKAYREACTLRDRGESEAAGKQIKIAYDKFTAAMIYAKEQQKNEVRVWQDKCENFSKSNSLVSSSNKWTISWDEENQCIQLKSGNQIVLYKMIRVEGGSYSKEDTTVAIMNFSIGETEVTELLWNVVMKDGYSSKNLMPKTNVSYAECYQFIDKLSEKTGVMFRLPEANEWEYAASGGNKTKGYKYAGSNELTQITFIDGKLHPVKGKGENELGLYDMTGNAYEWTSSLSQSGSRILKGGCFFGANGGDDDRSLKITASQRFRDADKRDDFGFRIVKSYE